MAKSADAFRTISEVADWLGSPAHVLRFWESKFTQVKPVKRAGGRRYYRPADMLLLGGIKKLLHDDGMTIKGVQKVLREQGIKYVSSLSDPLDGDFADPAEEVDAAPQNAPLQQPMDEAAGEPGANVLQFQRELDDAVEQYSEEMEADEDDLTPEAPDEELLAGAALDAVTDPDPAENAATEASALNGFNALPPAGTEDEAAPGPDDAMAALPGPEDEAAPLEDFASPAMAVPEFEPDPADKPALSAEIAAAPAQTAEAPDDLTPEGPAPEDLAPEATAPGAAPADDGPALPSFMAPPPAEAAEQTPQHTQPETPAAPRPEILDLPPVPSDDAIVAPPGLLSRLAAMQGRKPAAGNMAEIAALRDRLAALHARRGAGGTASGTPEH